MINQRLQEVHKQVHPHVKELNQKLNQLGFAVKDINIVPLGGPEGPIQPRVCTFDQDNVQHCFP
jgi:hypothetical protein